MEQLRQQINQQIETTKRWKYIKWAVAVVCILAASVFLYNRFWPVPTPSIGYSNAAPVAGLAVPTETLTVIKPLRVYDKQKAVKKMELPAEIAADPKSALLATARMKPSEGGYTTAAVLDTETNITKLIVREEKAPLLGFGGKTHIGGVVGISNRGNMAIGYVSQNIVRIGPVNIGVAGAGGVIGTDAVIGAGLHINMSF